MKTIYKYLLVDRRIPAHADVLHVGIQAGEPCAWCQVDTEKLAEDKWRGVVAIPTGGDLSVLDDGKIYAFIGTAVGIENWMVMHFFEEI